MTNIKTRIRQALSTGATTKRWLLLQEQLNAELRSLNSYRIALYNAITEGLPYKIGDTVKVYGGGLLTENEYLIGIFTIYDMQVTDQGKIIWKFAQGAVPVDIEYAYFEKA